MTLSHRLPPSPSSHPKLISSHPSSSAPAIVRISHVQLRDLIVCPAERGVLWYVGDNAILEQDIISNTPPQSIASLKFTPVTLSTLRLASSCPGGKDVLILAAGGQDAELFLGMYLYHPRRTRQRKHQQNLYEPPLDTRPQETLHLSQDISIDAETDLDVKEEEQDEHPGYSTSVWQHTSSLVGSINNNVLLYMPPPPLHEHDMYEDNEEDREVSPRLVVSNNDCTVKFFDVCLARKGLRRPPALQRPQERAAAAVDSRYWRQDPGYAYRATYEGEGWEKGSERVVRYERVGCLRLPVPVNHTSISPDGSTVLSCGDASTIYLHRILPVRDGSTLLFEPLATYTIPPPTPLPPLPPPSSSPVSQRRTFLHRYVGQNDPGGQYLPFAFVNGSWVLAGPHPYISDVSGMEIPPACFTTAWSADGMRFAVASQEGMVRVWDVRSKEPLGCAGWETGPGGAAAAAAAAAAASAASASASASDATPGATGSAQDGRDESLSSAIATAALNYDTQRALFEFTGGAPPWGVRSLKFARNASGREVLVFTEHVSRVHVIDADTFSRHDVLRIPHVQPSTSAPPQARDPHSQQYPRHHHHHHHRSSGARLPVFRPPQPSSSTSLNTPPPSTNNAPTPTNALAATQMYAIPPADLPRWLLDGAANANANVGYSYVPNFLFNTSAVWRGAEDAAVPRAGPGVDGASGANAAAGASAATPRLATRLEGRARARRLGLVPPRISRPESEREGNNASSNSSSTNLRAPMGRVLSPSLPLTRSPDPAGTALFRTSLHDFGVEPERGEEAGNSGSDTDYQARLRRRYSAASSPGSRSGSGSGNGSAGTIGGGRAGRRDVMVRLREMERARRQGEAQEGSELRRRSPAILRSRDPVSAGASGVEAGSESRLRDDAQMEEDIAFHAARERERERDRAELSYRIREVRERIQAGREREQARAREEREQDELEFEREHEHEREAAYTAVPEDAEGGPVLIPPLSSTRSEEDVRSVLAAHGIASVRTQALGAESTAASASAAAVEAQEEGADDARSERSQVLFASDERRPGSSSSASSSSASSTTRSSVSGVTGYTGITGVSTRAQAGSLAGEMHGASASASTSADMGSSTVPYPHAASEPGAGDDFEANENSSTSLSTTASQRRRRLDSTALMTPSIRNMRAAQAALRAMDDALDDYRMEVDEDVESHSHADPEQDVDLDEDRDAEGEEEESDSDATELDCAEPPSVLEQGRTAEGEDSSFNQEVSVSSSTSASLSSHVGTASTAQLPSSSSSISISSPGFSTPFQPTHSRSQSLPIPQPQQQRQSVPQSQPQAQSQSQSQSQPQQQQAQPQPQGQTLPPCRDLIESTDRLDIAGITFDPSGAYMYVATVDGITEWAVQGVEQRWWHTGGCL